MTGLLFNIQKFSLHDGPGIRTTVFFKSCPLRCLWCSNPESQSGAVSLFWDKDGTSRPDSREYTLEETLRICLEDKSFYDESGGGVTLSGGEALSQPDFAAALLSALKNSGVRTAIETSGYAPPEVFARVAALSDLLLFDIKHYDSLRHQEGTRQDNAPILANLKSAVSFGIELLPRIPVIPGFNNGAEDAREFASMLSRFGLKRVQLLPFHQFGEKKYEMLKQNYKMKGIKQLHSTEIENYRSIIADAGIECVI